MSKEPSETLRALKPDDLERVVEIDCRITGRARKQFFEKRLQAALADTAGFITVATQSGNEITGFAIARLQNGEFGIERGIAVLDVIGVDPESQKHGQGTKLIDGIAAYAKKLGITEIRTQLDWHNKDLLGFFTSHDFLLAPNHVLERATTRHL
ncbi:MAG: GNAT family N-acetyltransferase [Rhodospirillales bacterium]|nr:GNAT family N-acetyltransferase [Rhodospirillales bacterium]